MTDRRFSTADTTMTDIYYILTEGCTQPLLSWGSIWNAFSASSAPARQDRRAGRAHKN